MKCLVTNIHWDTDGEEVDLPQEITMAVPKEWSDIPEEWLSDEITNFTGFCHFGFEFEEIE
jgi:hypothetical protein